MIIDLSTLYKDVETRFVTAGDSKFAIRALGQATGTPLVLLNHWGANLDNFDPAIVDALAAHRPVYAVNYRGIGASGGQVRTSIADIAADMIALIRAITTSPVDLLGFSLGGFVAQQIALTEPTLVRRMILAGTGPAGGVGGETIVGVTVRALIFGAFTLRDPKYYLFFTSSKASRHAAKAFLSRLKIRVADRDKVVSPAQFQKQLTAVLGWSRLAPQPLDLINIPVLVANGDSDTMVPSENSKDLATRIAGAQLVLYPDAGHGGIFQYHEDFIERANVFLKM